MSVHSSVGCGPILKFGTDEQKRHYLPDMAQGISAFIVPTETAGFIVSPPEHKLGIRGSDTCAVTFEDCRIPAGSLLGTLRSRMHAHASRRPHAHRRTALPNGGLSG
jgi:alkylation response protein AidB-like acyl-CoA dehydrogenase